MMSVSAFLPNSLVPVPLQLQCTLPQQELPVRNKDDSRSVVHNLQLDLLQVQKASVEM
jgi:hypothetical protein